ncbi:nicotinate phosphoribosyltransferase [Mycena floridula]|nr:nicotinate phosphoribosyltransferase [Mycena floridula]
MLFKTRDGSIFYSFFYRHHSQIMAISTPVPAVPCSILDTDLYKLTMQQAVLLKFGDVPATYRFTLRDKTVSFSKQCIDAFRLAVSKFSEVYLTEAEHAWLQKTCPYFSSEYLSYLAQYRYKPEQVHITFVPHSENGDSGVVEIEAVGPWVETILWEVPLMACLSETYFKTVDTDWNYDGQQELAYSKSKTLIEAGAKFMEFGTRRRRSAHAQDLVIAGLVQASKEVEAGRGKLLGTSNVYFAQKYGIAPAGTVAHEWFMGIAALESYETVNSVALKHWEDVYPSSPLLALTDTFSSEAFFKSFTQEPERVHRWHGLRHDSGDPYAFATRAKEVYDSFGINANGKKLVFSDGLDIEKALKLQKHSEELGFDTSFGIGTFLTNDFRTASSGGVDKSKSLNMVIKLSSVDDKPCIKLSDDLTKSTGDSATVAHVKKLFDLPH